MASDCEHSLALGSDLEVRVSFEERLSFEALLLEISARFVNLPAEKVDHEIEDAQTKICKNLQIDHSSLWQEDPADPGVLLLTHLYRDPQLRPRPTRMVGNEAFPWVQARLMAGEIVCVPDTSNPPAGAEVDRENWLYYSIRSTLAVPLAVGGGPIFGVLSFESTRQARTWPDALQKRLRLIASVFANALERKNTDRKLSEGTQRLALAADCANAGLWTLDVNSGQIWATDKAYELLGLPPGGPLDLDRVMSLVHPHDRKRMQQRIARAVETGKDVSVVYRVVLDDGPTRWFVSRGRLRPGTGSERPSVMGVTIDITQSKLLQQGRAEFTAQLLRAQEEERERIARELHDDLGQSATVLSLRLQQSLNKLGQGSAISEESLRDLADMSKRLGDKISVISHRLHSTELEMLGFELACQALCRQFSQDSGIKIKCSCGDFPINLERKVETALYRVLQEALHNAVKYSRAQKIEVHLRSVANELRLRVTDDGTGFDLSQRRTRSGLGLTSMSERMRLLGGRLSIGSQPGSGTVIEARVPLPAKLL